jgi:hypothetical protein
MQEAVMKDGIDHQTYRARLRNANSAERKRYAGELGAWMRSAALSRRGPAYWGLAFLAVGVALAILSIRSGTERDILAVASVIFAGGLALSWIGNKHAREWRRAHPFEEWRTSRRNDR